MMMNTSANVSEVQTPTPEQLQLQMQMQAAAMFNPYAAQFLPFPGFPQQQFPDYFQMYMQMGMPPGVPAVPVESEQSKEQTPSPTRSTDSGNETISPLQQQQQTPSNPYTPTVSPPFPGVSDPSQQMVITPQVKASPYAINNIIGSSVSEKTSPTNQGAEEEKENGSQRRNTIPKAVTRRRRPTPYERNPMLLHTSANPFFKPNPATMGLPQALMDMYQRSVQDYCAVCGDRATGYHYGVLSCEGCKGFFRRLAHSKKKLECEKGAKCEFRQSPELRTACQSCRFAHCISAGMNKELVRDPNGKKKASTTDELPPAAEALVESFLSNMPRGMTINSKEEACACIGKFIKNVPELAALLPESEATTEKIEMMMPALMTLRVAFSLDSVTFVTEGNDQVTDTIEKLRHGIRCTILHVEELAILSGIYIAQFVNGPLEGVLEVYFKGLRQHFDATKSQDSGTSDRLIMRMGLLMK